MGNIAHGEAGCCSVWDCTALPLPQYYHGALCRLLGRERECTFVLVCRGRLAKKCVLFDIRKSMVPPPPFHIFFSCDVLLKTTTSKVKITSSTLYFTAMQFHHKQKSPCYLVNMARPVVAVSETCALPQPQCYHGAFSWLLGLASECTFVLVCSSKSAKYVLSHNSNIFPEFSKSLTTETHISLLLHWIGVKNLAFKMSELGLQNCDVKNSAHTP